MFAYAEETIERNEFFAPWRYASKKKTTPRDLLSLRCGKEYEDDVHIWVSPCKLNVINGDNVEELSKLMKRFAGVRHDPNWILWFDGKPLHFLDTASLARNFMFLDGKVLAYSPEKRLDSRLLYDNKRQSLQSRIAIYEEFVNCGLAEHMEKSAEELSEDEKVLLCLFSSVIRLPKIIVINQSLDCLADDVYPQAVKLLKLAISKGSTVVLGCLNARSQLKPYAPIIHYQYLSGKIIQS